MPVPTQPGNPKALHPLDPNKNTCTILPLSVCTLTWPPHVPLKAFHVPPPEPVSNKLLYFSFSRGLLQNGFSIQHPCAQHTNAIWTKSEHRASYRESQKCVLALSHSGTAKALPITVKELTTMFSYVSLYYDKDHRHNHFTGPILDLVYLFISCLIATVSKLG